jgi:hypothetical protein
MRRSVMPRFVSAAVLSAATAALVPTWNASAAPVSATILPGTLSQGSVQASLTGGSHANEANNLGDWPLNTGGTSTKFALSFTNANFNGNSFGGTPNSIIAFGNGGGVTLKFASPVTPVAGQKEFGLFTAQMLVASSGALFSGNMEAAILVSGDNLSWRTLAGDSVASPTTYTATSYKLNAPTMSYDYVTSSQAASYGSPGTSAANLNALSVADFQSPMPDDNLFNGTGTNAQRLALKTDTSQASYDAIFGASGGGNWFDISASGLSEVNYLRLNGVNVGTGSLNGVRLDAVFANAAAVPEPAGVALALVGTLLFTRRRSARGTS